MQYPSIRKAKEIIGHKLRLVDAQVKDAEFVTSLRTNERLNRYLSPTAPDVSAQCRWLERYAADSTQAYFVIWNGEERIGTVRLYDQRGHSFCWGSWLMAESAPMYAAIESALMVYSYAAQLGFKEAHFDVRKDNLSVWKFHERFGAIRVAATDRDFFYKITEADIAAALERYKKFLPNGIQVSPA